MFLKREVNLLMYHEAKWKMIYFKKMKLIEIQTGLRRNIIQLKTFPIRPNVIRTTAIICKMFVYL